MFLLELAHSKRLNVLFTLAFPFVFFAGCKVLSKQEKSSVTAFAQAIQSTADLPKQSVDQYYQIVMETAQANATLMTNASDIVHQLDSLLVFQKSIDTFVAEYGTRYGVLKKYASVLLSLVDTSYLNELQRQKDAFVPAFDTLATKYNAINPAQSVPVKSLGDLFKKIIDKTGSYRINHLQRKYLKELVEAADSALPAICDQYKLDSISNDRRLNTLKVTVTESFKSFWNYINLHNNGDTYSNYKIYNPIYLGWQNKISVLIELNKTNASAFRKVKMTHEELKKLLTKKSTFKEFFQRMKDLYGDINTLKESYSKLEKDFTPSKTKK